MQSREKRNVRSEGGGVTFTYVPIAQVATPATVALVAAVTGLYTRLHALVGSLNGGGSVQLVDSSGTAVTGVMTSPTGTPVCVPFTADLDGCPITAVSKGLSLTSVTGGFNGYAIVSQGAL
jgi:hypothetical protein